MAFNGGPRTGRVAQSTSNFVVLSVFFVEKRGPDLSPFFGHDFVAKTWALSKFEAAARCVGQVLSPFSGQGSETSFIQNLRAAHVYFRELRRDYCWAASVGGRSQPMTLLWLAHAACPHKLTFSLQVF